MNKQEQSQQERPNNGLLIASGLLILISLICGAYLLNGFDLFPLVEKLWIGIPPFVIAGLWYRIGDTGKRSNVLIVMTSGTLLVHGVLVTAVVSTTADYFSGMAGLILYSFYLVVSFPLLTIAVIWFLVGLVSGTRKTEH